MDHINAHAVALQVIEARKNSVNAYDCLLLPRTASFVDVKAAYKRLLFLHPDKNPNLDVAHEAFRIVLQSYAEIKKANSPSEGFTTAAPVGNKWSVYTSAQAGEQTNHVDIPRGGIPSAAPQPPPPPPPPQQQTAWSSLPAQNSNSKWGRPSNDTTRLFKVLEPSASRLKTTLRPQSLDVEGKDVDHSAPLSEKDHLKHTSGANPVHNEHEDVIEIDCGSFYGGNSRSTAAVKLLPPSSTRIPAVGGAAQQQQGWKDGGASKWSDSSRKNPLAELLRNPGATTATTTEAATVVEEKKLKKNKKRAALKAKDQAPKKRQATTRVLIDSDSDDSFNKPRRKAEYKELISAESSSDDDGGHGGDSSSDGWDSHDEDFKEEQTAVSKAAGEAKSKSLIQLLLAQQRSQAKHRLQAGAAGTARNQRAAFVRRGGKKRRQTRLKLAPITSK
jgi:hypothetical protein